MTEILTDEALAFVADLQRAVRRPPRRAARRRGRAPGADRPRPGGWTSCRRPRTIRDGRLAVAPAPGRPGRPAGGDHRPDRAQDGDQRAQLRRQGLAGRPRGRQHPALGQRRRRPGQPVRRGPPAPSAYDAPDGRQYAPRTTARCRRSSCARAAGTSTSGTCRSTASRRSARWSTSACYFFHNAAELLARGSGPYFYLPKMESHLEARLWNDVFTYAAGRARHPARHDPGHRADRDDPGRVRDGGDPLRAARRTPPGLNAGRWDYLFSIIKNFRDAGPTSCCPTATR